MDISSNLKLVRSSNGAPPGQTQVNSSSVDMQGYESCLFLIVMSSINAGAVTSIKLQQSSDEGVSDTWADLEGSGIDVEDDEDGQMFYVEVTRPQERYIRCVVIRSVANATVNSIISIRNLSREMPIVQESDVRGKLVTSPAEGAP